MVDDITLFLVSILCFCFLMRGYHPSVANCFVLLVFSVSFSVSGQKMRAASGFGKMSAHD